MKDCCVSHARRLEHSVCGVVLMQLQSCRTALIARVVVDVCCHCLCVIALVESFLGDRLAHRNAASNSFGLCGEPLQRSGGPATSAFHEVQFFRPLLRAQPFDQVLLGKTKITKDGKTSEFDGKACRGQIQRVLLRINCHSMRSTWAACTWRPDIVNRLHDWSEQLQ